MLVCLYRFLLFCIYIFHPLNHELFIKFYILLLIHRTKFPLLHNVVRYHITAESSKGLCLNLQVKIISRAVLKTEAYLYKIHINHDIAKIYHMFDLNGTLWQILLSTSLSPPSFNRGGHCIDIRG